MISGFALIDKPRDWTSHDVVGRLRRIYGQRRVGHAGTLDPMATGVLIVGLGSATRLLRFVQGQPKTYQATIRLGIATTTDDAQGETVAQPGWQLAPDTLREAIASLTGSIAQVPSAVSAVKVDGVRSYARVRRGDAVELQARQVEVRRFEIVGGARQVGDCVDLDVVVECSSGTYIRALARDLGASLGSAGHLTALRRTAIGSVTVDMCDQLGEQPPPVASPTSVMRGILPILPVGPEDLEHLRHGRPIAVDGVHQGFHAAVDAEGDLAAVVDVLDGHTKVAVNLVGQ